MENQEVVKQAAQRMTAFFAESGVEVKHSLVLEGIAKGFGMDGWRKLKAVLDAPRARTAPIAPIKPAKLAKPLGEMQCWRVRGILDQESQPYGDDFYGRTPLEAAIECIVSRRVEGDGIRISEVLDADEEPIFQPWSLNSIELLSMHDALELLVFNVLHVVSSTYSEPQYVAATWLNASLRGQPLQAFDRLTGYLENRVAAHQDFDGRLKPTEVLASLAEHVIERCGGVVALEADDHTQRLALACYQVLSLAENCASAVNAKGSPLMAYPVVLPKVPA